MKKNIYKIHRSLSVIIAIPVLLWAVSGFMHPLMTNIKPAVATQVLKPSVIDSSKVHTSLENALYLNHIDSIQTFRLIHIDTSWFYQVQLAPDKIPVYLSVIHGKQLTAGDWLYAQYLAQQFLEGQKDNNGNHTMSHDSQEQNAAQDCCDAATTCVLKNYKGSKVKEVSLLHKFDSEYKYINRLLPVYKVSFDRADGIRVYVETTQDRFAFAMDNKRATFDTIFRWMHTWEWLSFTGNFRAFVIGLVALLAFTTSILGIFIFFSTKSKKAKGNDMVKARKRHRVTAIIAALFTLMWTFSGAFHAFSKFKVDDRDKYFIVNNFPATDIQFNLAKIQKVLQKPVSNVSLIKMNHQEYWQVSTPANSQQKKTKGVQKVGIRITYINVKDYSLLENGDNQYARHLATVFSGKIDTSIISSESVTKFTDEYNFTDKRLPVWKVSYPSNHQERWYIETTSGKLASRVNNIDLPEGYSFSLFHKHHFMDWGGKTVRDISTMFWAFVQIIMVLAGIILYLKWKKRQAKKIDTHALISGKIHKQQV